MLQTLHKLWQPSPDICSLQINDTSLIPPWSNPAPSRWGSRAVQLPLREGTRVPCAHTQPSQQDQNRDVTDTTIPLLISLHPKAGCISLWGGCSCVLQVCPAAVPLLPCLRSPAVFCGALALHQPHLATRLL